MITSGQSLKTMWRNLAKLAVDPRAPIGVLVQMYWVAIKGSVKALQGLDSFASDNCQKDPDKSKLLMILGFLLAAKFNDSLISEIWYLSGLELALVKRRS